MKVLILGGTGLLGTMFCDQMSKLGIVALPIGRSTKNNFTIGQKANRALFEEIDVDESGDLTFDELLTFIRSKSKRLRFQRELEQKIGKRNIRRGQRKSELLPIREAKLSLAQARSLYNVKARLLPVE